MDRKLAVSEKMHEELLIAANSYRNARGIVALCDRRTEKALIRRDLITYDDRQSDTYPVITLAGWEYLASKGFKRRAEDPGRLTLEEALAEAYPAVEKAKTPAMRMSEKMDEELLIAADSFQNSRGIVAQCDWRTEDLDRARVVPPTAEIREALKVLRSPQWSAAKLAAAFKVLDDAGIFAAIDSDPAETALPPATGEAKTCCDHAGMYHGARGCDLCSCTAPCTPAFKILDTADVFAAIDSEAADRG